MVCSSRPAGLLLEVAMWALILTLVITRMEVPALATVTGFATEAACEAAGERWRLAMGSLKPRTEAVFVCVNAAG